MMPSTDAMTFMRDLNEEQKTQNDTEDETGPQKSNPLLDKLFSTTYRVETFDQAFKMALREAFEVELKKMGEENITEENVFSKSPIVEFPIQVHIDTVKLLLLRMKIINKGLANEDLI